MRQLALSVGLDYKTVQGHIELLVENGIINTPKKEYGSVYFLNAEWDDNDYLKKLLKGDKDEKNK